MYRRRRAVATIGSALAVLVLIWAAGALLSSASDDSVSNAASQQSAGVTLTSRPSSNPPSVGRLLPADASSSSSASSSLAAPSPLLSGAPLPPPGPGSSVFSAAPSPTTTTAPPAPPQQCPDNVVKLIATIAQPSYQVGQHPELTMHMVNAGPVPCFRDVSRPLRALQVVPEGSFDPLWSSGDCYSVPSHEVPTLAPGQEVSYSVAWAGRTSAPGCPEARSTVPAGHYAVIARLGPLASAPTPFTLT